uniref:Molybdenum cofactor sulfurase middle domain-containing protein n=2 Tax=Hyaloperonospora arabidopsidis (strain Emoy2) TaxID=559515 RepID=M4BHA9_HYAAE
MRDFGRCGVLSTSQLLSQKSGRLDTSLGLPCPTVSGLFVYPIKSCAGISIQETQLTVKGLVHDREWAIIDGQRNKVMTQRRYPKLALIRPKVLPRLDTEESKTIVLTAEGMSDIEVPVARAGDGELRAVTIWDDTVEAVDQGDAAAMWLDSFLGEGLNCSFRLVRAKEGFTRHTKPKYAPRHSTHFADAFPFLLALEESLEEFNTKLEVPVPMNRFRPNVNQATGEVHPERQPSRTIVRERNGARLGFTDGKKHEGYFGSNLVLEMKELNSISPRLAVGANVKVLSLKTEVVA